jgi:outer membrane protein
MKNALHTLIAAAASALLASTAHAQAAPKIFIVDLAKIISSNWKVQEQQAKLNADEAKAQKEIDRMAAEGKALVDELKDLDEQTKSPAASADAKARAQAAAQAKYDEIQRKRNEQTQYAQNATNTLRERSEAFKGQMFAEISRIATEIAKRKGATLLLDKAGPSMMGVSNILYYDPSLEITDEVIAAANRDRPATVPAPGSASSPATPPAPGDTPTITVPGFTPSK